MNKKNNDEPHRQKKGALEILCLEDSPLDAELIYNYLQENFLGEIKMDIIFKEEDFIDGIRSKKYDVILSDFNLPGFNGFKALQHAKAVCPTTPFICISGFIGEETAVELLKRGATDYVSKDKFGRLIFSLERALKESKETEEKIKREEEILIANKKLKKRNKEILFLHYHDLLTNLYNRIYFEMEKDRLDKQNKLPISIIMGDINGLKLINDGFGESRGDQILIEGAKILISCCRKQDVVARIGGGEFAVLLPETDSDTAQLICRKIFKAGKEAEKKSGLICPSVSIGCATKTLENENLDSTFRIAEQAMSRQKLLETKSAHSSIIASIKTTMFEKSHETAEHAERLIHFSKMIGVEISLRDEELNDLELLATLHDIGKMSIEHDILSKEDQLNEREWYEMKKHPMVGCRIAQATPELIPIANFILCHHERWDGKGYPQGLLGEETPLLSRILAVVDSFDAMTNNRPYRRAMAVEEAIEEIRINAGTQFDPVLAQIFIKLLLAEIANKIRVYNSGVNTI